MIFIFLIFVKKQKSMKIGHLIFMLTFIILFSCHSKIDTDDTQSIGKISNEVRYDSIAAINYGADAYGMKKYVMAFLRRGTNRNLDSIQASELQKAHLENIVRLAEEGKLVLAGPFFGSGDIRGIYIFNVGSIEEAKMLTETDPAIVAGSLEMELKEWYGSAALVAVNDIHKTLARKGIID
jgi:uncharacterized protein YciI